MVLTPHILIRKQSSMSSLVPHARIFLLAIFKVKGRQAPLVWPIGHINDHFDFTGFLDPPYIYQVPRAQVEDPN